ncbi:MAG TPA: hypothetical protein VFF27_17345 [Bacteroidia bacterium]|nr:hypothetical protein [Bacteroidia bacterium]
MESYLTSGVKTKAVVIESFYSKGPRLMYQFQVDEKIYTSFRYKDIGGHRKGDTLEIIYYRKEPVMNTSIELYMEDLKD